MILKGKIQFLTNKNQVGTYMYGVTYKNLFISIRAVTVFLFDQYVCVVPHPIRHLYLLLFAGE